MENSPTPAPTPAPASNAPIDPINSPQKSHTGLIVALVLAIITIATGLTVLFTVVLPNLNKTEEDNKKDTNTSQNQTKDPDPTPNPDPDPTPTNKTNTLTCTQAFSGEGYTQTVAVYFNYTEGILSSITLTEETYKDSGFTDDEIKNAQKESNTYYDSTKYTKWVVRRKDSHTAILEAELSLTGNDVSVYETYEAAKSYTTTQGYKCK